MYSLFSEDFLQLFRSGPPEEKQKKDVRSVALSKNDFNARKAVHSERNVQVDKTEKKKAFVTKEKKPKKIPETITNRNVNDRKSDPSSKCDKVSKTKKKTVTVPNLPNILNTNVEGDASVFAEQSAVPDFEIHPSIEKDSFNKSVDLPELSPFAKDSKCIPSESKIGQIHAHKNSEEDSIACAEPKIVQDLFVLSDLPLDGVHERWKNCDTETEDSLSLGLVYTTEERKESIPENQNESEEPKAITEINLDNRKRGSSQKCKQTSKKKKSNYHDIAAVSTEKLFLQSKSKSENETLKEEESIKLKVGLESLKISRNLKIQDHSIDESKNEGDPVNMVTGSVNSDEGPFVCTICGKEFVQNYLLKWHMKTHKLVKQICKTCGKTFIDNSELKLHMKSHKVRKYICNICGEKFARKFDLNIHSKTHKVKKSFSCSTCGKTFDRSDTLKIHNKTHGLEKPYKCEICEKEFSQSNELKFHSRIHKEQKKEESFFCISCGKGFVSIGKLKDHEKKHSEEKSFGCDVCGKGFDRSSQYKNHLETKSHREKCEAISGVTPTTEEKNTPPPKSKKKNRSGSGRSNAVLKPRGPAGPLIRFPCTFCGKIFSKNFTLTVHIRTHTGEKPFVCSTCGKGFTKNAHLEVHTRIHTGEKPYSCNVCDQRFSHSTTLQTHMRSHTGDKPFTCGTCGKGFSRKTHMRNHENTHKEEKPHSCKICGKGFVHSTALKTHSKIHTGEKPFKCSTCGKGFTQKGTLTDHEKIHSGENLFPCKVCGKGFTQSGALKRHEITHTEEKPFVCPTCGKGCATSANLKSHEKSHTGEKPFTCHFCGTGFTGSNSLEVHLRSHTGEKPYVCIICGRGFASSNYLRGHLKTHERDAQLLKKTKRVSVSEKEDNPEKRSETIAKRNNGDRENSHASKPKYNQTSILEFIVKDT